MNITCDAAEFASLAQDAANWRKAVKAIGFPSKGQSAIDYLVRTIEGTGLGQMIYSNGAGGAEIRLLNGPPVFIARASWKEGDK